MSFLDIPRGVSHSSSSCSYSLKDFHFPLILFFCCCFVKTTAKIAKNTQWLPFLIPFSSKNCKIKLSTPNKNKDIGCLFWFCIKSNLFLYFPFFPKKMHSQIETSTKNTKTVEGHFIIIWDLTYVLNHWAREVQFFWLYINNSVCQQEVIL